MTEPNNPKSLVDAVSSWALPFHYHRDIMNANLHGTIHVKWSDVTRQLALGLLAAGEITYEANKVMYSWDEHDPDLEDYEREVIRWWRGRP